MSKYFTDFKKQYNHTIFLKTAVSWNKDYKNLYVFDCESKVNNQSTKISFLKIFYDEINDKTQQYKNYLMYVKGYALIAKSNCWEL